MIPIVIHVAHSPLGKVRRAQKRTLKRSPTVRCADRRLGWTRAHEGVMSVYPFKSYRNTYTYVSFPLLLEQHLQTDCWKIERERASEGPNLVFLQATFASVPFREECCKWSRFPCLYLRIADRNRVGMSGAEVLTYESVQENCQDFLGRILELHEEVLNDALKFRFLVTFVSVCR